MPKSTIFFSIFLFFIISKSDAQISVGAVLNAGIHDGLGYGITAKFDITDRIGIAPSFILIDDTSTNFSSALFTTKSYTNYLNIDLHYRLTKGEKGYLYPIFGAQFHSRNTFTLEDTQISRFSLKNTKFGYNAGLGGQLNLSPRITGLLEAKYSSPTQTINFSTGLRFNF